jgi:hypothetical protein
MNNYPIEWDKNTPEEVKPILERYLHTDTRLRLHYGSIETGQDWEDEFDNIGYIGKSTGTKPILLLIKNSRSMGGGGILTGCIVKISINGRVLYQHKNYHHKTHEVKPSDLPEYAEMALSDGVIQARFKKTGQAQKWVDYIEGNRNNKS